jgi:hypothetical protein
VNVPPGVELSAKVFKYWVIDREKKQIRIIMQTGDEVTEPIGDDDPILKSEVLLSIFDWEKWWVESVTKRKDFVVAEGYSPIHDVPYRGRPVVYLDQNHWRTVAQAFIDPSAIPKAAEAEPALELIRLGSDAGIILPLSSAHLRETAPMYGDLRYRVGIAMAKLSGGWQMRHPTKVWAQEAVRMVAAELGLEAPASAALPVITLEPHAFLDDDVDAYAMDPSDAQLFFLALTSPALMLDLLIDPEPYESGNVDAWVDRNQAITDYLATIEASAVEKGKMAHLFLWSDNTVPFRAALSELRKEATDLAHLTRDNLPRFFAREPMLARLAYLYSQRYINEKVRWKRNDLTDITFLSCAAAYADYVAAENHTGEQLKQFQRKIGGPPRVHRTLESLVEQLKADGVRSAAETAGQHVAAERVQPDEQDASGT